MGTDMFQLPDIFEILILTHITAKEAISEFPTISPDLSRTLLFLSSAHLHHRAYSASNTLWVLFYGQFTGYDPEWPHIHWRCRKTPSTSDSNWSSHSCSIPLPGTASGAEWPGWAREGMGCRIGPTEKEGRRAVKSCEWFYRISQPSN